MKEKVMPIIKNALLPVLSLVSLILTIIFRFSLPASTRIGMGLVFLIITMVISLFGVLQNTRKNVWQRLIILALVVTVALALYFMVNNLDLGEEVTATDRALEMTFLVLFSLTVIGAGVYATLIGIKLENSLEPEER